jgi:hypothetical protein
MISPKAFDRRERLSILHFRNVIQTSGCNDGEAIKNRFVSAQPGRLGDFLPPSQPAEKANASENHLWVRVNTMPSVMCLLPHLIVAR